MGGDQAGLARAVLLTSLGLAFRRHERQDPRIHIVLLEYHLQWSSPHHQIDGAIGVVLREVECAVLQKEEICLRWVVEGYRIGSRNYVEEMKDGKQ